MEKSLIKTIMDTTAKKAFVLFRRKDGNFGIVSSRAFFNKIGGNKAKQFLECTELNQSDVYEDLQAEIQALTEPKNAIKVEAKAEPDATIPTPEEIEALHLKTSGEGFKKTNLTKRDKEIQAYLKGGENE